MKKLEDPEKRVISLSVRKQGGQTEIELTNFFDGVVASAGGTTKQDAHRHGFGTMSMRYIAQEYGGSVSIQIQKDVYTLLIVLPLPAA